MWLLGFSEDQEKVEKVMFGKAVRDERGDVLGVRC